MSDFIRIVEVVLPVLIILLFGYLGKKTKLLKEEFLDSASKVVFKVFMPINLFVNVYRASSLDVVNPLIIIYTLIAMFIALILGYFIYKRLGIDQERMAIMLQTLVRSNIVLYGLSIAQNYFNNDGVAVVAIYIGIISALSNGLALIIHEIFSIKNEKISIRQIVFNIFKNTIFLASITGILFKLSNISIYSPIMTALDNVAGVATPLGLICVGGSLKFNKESYEPLESLALRTAVLAKSVVVPILFLPIFAFLGLTGPEMFFIIIVFAAPVAVSSHAISVAYTSKGDFCAKIVVYTTVFNSLTVFFAIYFLSTLKII